MASINSRDTETNFQLYKYLFCAHLLRNMSSWESHLQWETFFDKTICLEKTFSNIIICNSFCSQCITADKIFIGKNLRNYSHSPVYRFLKNYSLLFLLRLFLLRAKP